jgi:ArsR family transcriptional regulator
MPRFAIYLLIRMLGNNVTATATHLSTLADPTRNRILLLLEPGELAVGELAAILRLPQSTISRQLKILTDDGWLSARNDGTSRFYRMELNAANRTAARLWDVIREEASEAPSALQDAARRASVIADRRRRSKQYFMSNAAAWDETRQTMYGTRIDLHVALALLEPETTVADLGCGTGSFVELLAGVAARVVAIDESPEMLTAARARLTGHTNVELHQAPLEQLPAELPAVDTAVLALVLHYVTEPRRVLSEAFRVLRPGGRLVILDMAAHDQEDLRATMGHLWAGFSDEQLRLWLEGAGFQSPALRRLPPDPRAKGPSLVLATGRKPTHSSRPHI